MGFLNEQSLGIIWNASRLFSQDSACLHFSGMISNSIHLRLTQSGQLRRLFIAAKFNATAHFGWPELQIMNTTDTYNVTLAMEPRPTGYLNVYEYELNKNFTVQSGDVLTISWPQHYVSQHNQIRFSLAQYDNGSAMVPMVSIILGNCDRETDLLTLNSLYCEEATISPTSDTTAIIRNVTSTPATKSDGLVTSTIVTTDLKESTRPEFNASDHTTAGIVNMTKESINTTQASMNQTNKSESEVNLSTTNETVLISGVVVFSLFLLITLIIFVAVFTLVVKRRRKSASLNAINSTEMNNQPRMLYNTPSKSTNNYDNSSVYLAMNTSSRE